MKKRTLSLLLVLILVVAMVPISARAANTYDAQKAVAWASNDAEHRKVSTTATKGTSHVIKCAEYVSMCLQKGGMPVPTYTTPGNIMNWVVNNEYGTKYEINDSSLNLLEPGDFVVWVCDKKHGYDICGLHTVFVSSVNRTNKTFTICGNNWDAYNEPHDFSWLKTHKNYCQFCDGNAYSHGYIVHTNKSNNPTPLNLGNDFYGYLVLVKDWKHLSATGKNVQIAAVNDVYDPAQIWRFVRQSDGSYKIMNAYWDGIDGVRWCMDCTEAGTTNGTNVGVWPDNGNANQRWFIYDKGDYKKQLIPGHCSLALDATGDSSAPGTNIELWTQNTSTAQLYNVWPLSSNNTVYTKPEKPAASVYSGAKNGIVNNEITLQWTESPKVNDFDKRTYKIVVTDEAGNTVLSKDALTGTTYNHTFAESGTYTFRVTAVNSYYRSYETVGEPANIRISTPSVAVTSVSLNKSTATIQKGKSTTLTATVKPSNATNKKVTWSSSDNDVATVDSSGTVRGVKAGTATITAKAGGKSASCKVIVKNGSVSVSSVSLNRSAVTLQKGKSTTLTATVKPNNATNKTVTWKSSNKKVATVSSGGKVTAKAAGTATITVTAGNKSASCKVTVKNSSSTIHGVNCASASYADVNKDSGHWTHLPIDYVLRKGYMQGVSEGEFAPNGTVTRAQIVQMLYAKEGKPAVSGVRKFRDVAGGKWYANAVAWASTKGVVAGYSDGTFKPEQAVTREQLVTIMYAYARYQGKDLTPGGRLSGFSDAESVSNYAKTPMQWAIGWKIISGMGYGLEPKGRSTRAQIAAILKAYDQNVK